MRKLCLILILIAIPTSLFAQDDPDWRNRRAERDRYARNTENAFELTPMIGYRYGGTLYADQANLFRTDVEVASHMNYGANFGIPIVGGLKVELMVNRQDTHFTRGSGLFTPNDNLGNFHITYFHGGLQIPFNVSRNVTPYIVVSAGIANLDPELANVSPDNKFSASGGVGVKVPIGRNAGIRLEARGYFTALDDQDRCSQCFYTRDHNLYQGETNLGLYLRF
jgi:hypothetical protein